MYHNISFGTIAAKFFRWGPPRTIIADTLGKVNIICGINYINGTGNTAPAVHVRKAGEMASQPILTIYPSERGYSTITADSITGYTTVVCSFSFGKCCSSFEDPG